MAEINFAEVQARFDRGEVTLQGCYRHGATHAAYGWACTPPGQFNEAQKAAYRAGFEGKRKPKEPTT